MVAKLIGVVGPCGAGKSTLTARMRELGYQVRHIAQEHSYAPSMWQRLTNPDLLVFLDASFPVATRRRNLNWTLREYQEQQVRLLHAKEHAHLYLVTDSLSPEKVLDIVINFLEDNSA